jgi:hypothetical protein
MYKNPEGIATIRLGLEPGLVVRSSSIPGLVGATWQGTPDRPEWVARVDPPLPDGATIGLEFWRPSPATKSAPGSINGQPSAISHQRLVRRFPRFEPLGVDRFTGSLAFRRPADWSGRLAMIPLLDPIPITEEAFVRAWGTLPEEPLTLSGATRFLRAPVLALRTGPLPVQLEVRPAVELSIGAGRVDVRSSAELFEISGHAHHAEIEIPPALRVVRVEADGLTDWSRVSPERIVLRFDGAPAKQRQVRFWGWVPVAADPLAPALPDAGIAVPWPRWPGIATLPGQLTVSSPTPFRITPLLASLAARESGPSSSAGPRFRESYRVDPLERPGQLRWKVEPPRLSVVVHSQITIHPDSVEWVAALRYDSFGGAFDTVLLQLPTSWAEPAKVELKGEDFRLTSQPRGATTDWVIRPEHPIWGTLRLVVRSSLPFSKASGVSFPDLVPLGQGSGDRVETYLAIANATGRDLVREGSTGLQDVEYAAAKFPADDVFGGLEGIPTSAYSVRKEGWSLRVRAPGDTGPAAAGEDPTRVSLADLVCVLSADGTTLGSARYEVEARPGAFLEVELAGGSEVLWAAVDQSPVPPLRSASGRWLIPLEEGGGASRVALIWKATATARPSGEGGRALPLPRPVLDQARVLTFLTVRAPAPFEVRSLDRAFEPVTRDRLEVEKAEWLGVRTAEQIATLNRSSLRDQEALVSSLYRFHVLLRGAERAAAALPPAATTGRGDPTDDVRKRAEASRTNLADALHAADFDQFDKAAQVHLGAAEETPDRLPLELLEPAAPVQICRLGRPHYFRGESNAAARPLILWSPGRPRAFVERSEVWLTIAGLIAAPVAVRLVVRRGERARWWGAATLAAALLALAAASGPLVLAAGLGLGALGRLTRD